MGRPCAGSERPRIARVADDGLTAALRKLGIAAGQPVVVLVGGAGGMHEHDVQALSAVLREAVLPVLGDSGAIVDGGTDTGVMRAAGRARSAAGVPCLLVGVAAEGTVAAPDGTSTAPGAPQVEPGHTHLVLVPGRDWGDESVWLARVATEIAAGHPSVTLLANGGTIAAGDVELGHAQGRPVIVLARTGRLSDEIASMPDDAESEAPAARIARSGLTEVVDVHDVDAVRSAVSAALPRPERNP